MERSREKTHAPWGGHQPPALRGQRQFCALAAVAPLAPGRGQGPGTHSGYLRGLCAPRKCYTFLNPLPPSLQVGKPNLRGDRTSAGDTDEPTESRKRRKTTGNKPQVGIRTEETSLPHCHPHSRERNGITVPIQ